VDIREDDGLLMRKKGVRAGRADLLIGKLTCLQVSNYADVKENTMFPMQNDVLAIGCHTAYHIFPLPRGQACRSHLTTVR